MSTLKEYVQYKPYVLGPIVQKKRKKKRRYTITAFISQTRYSFDLCAS